MTIGLLAVLNATAVAHGVPVVVTTGLELNGAAVVRVHERTVDVAARINVGYERRGGCGGGRHRGQREQASASHKLLHVVTSRRDMEKGNSWSSYWSNRDTLHITVKPFYCTAWYPCSEPGTLKRFTSVDHLAAPSRRQISVHHEKR